MDRDTGCAASVEVEDTVAARSERGTATRDRAQCEAWLFAVDGEEYAILEQVLGVRPFPAILTAAERAVAELAGAGLSNREIARRRGCSVNTVSKQASSAYRKLGLRGRASLQAWLASRADEP
jgi:DNA-binding CsgD family transcriptional regulator